MAEQPRAPILIEAETWLARVRTVCNQIISPGPGHIGSETNFRDALFYSGALSGALVNYSQSPAADQGITPTLDAYSSQAESLVSSAREALVRRGQQ
ncbi:MAG: hypothetical protein KKD18_06005 [Nanoarchaeota archaeon]|nr:hypothetical protein [Nanoarchaeota archaeon]MBU0977945.1 hypothetical protein [Nanoarchaeota archaeon]